MSVDFIPACAGGNFPSVILKKRAACRRYFNATMCIYLFYFEYKALWQTVLQIISCVLVKFCDRKTCFYFFQKAFFFNSHIVYYFYVRSSWSVRPRSVDFQLHVRLLLTTFSSAKMTSMRSGRDLPKFAPCWPPKQIRMHCGKIWILLTVLQPTMVGNKLQTFQVLKQILQIKLFKRVKSISFFCSAYYWLFSIFIKIVTFQLLFTCFGLWLDVFLNAKQCVFFLHSQSFLDITSYNCIRTSSRLSTSKFTWH